MACNTSGRPLGRAGSGGQRESAGAGRDASGAETVDPELRQLLTTPSTAADGEITFSGRPRSVRSSGLRDRLDDAAPASQERVLATLTRPFQLFGPSRARKTPKATSGYGFCVNGR